MDDDDIIAAERNTSVFPSMRLVREKIDLDDDDETEEAARHLQRMMRGRRARRELERKAMAELLALPPVDPRLYLG